ncbi:MAG: 4Fe-4S binding protein [Thermodesulfobacteriota bacterium]
MSLRGWRLLVQGLALLLIIVNPLLNYYLHITFVQGWYQSLAIGELWFVSPLEGLESILVARSCSLTLLIAMILPLGVALLLGRVFCGWICPIHYLSELSDLAGRLFTSKRRRKDYLVLPRKLLWFALLAELLLTMILGAPLFVFLSPPGLVGREIMMAIFFHTLAVEGVAVLLVLLLNLITRRFYCRYLCPLGGLLALLGRRRRLRVVLATESCTACGRCGRSCPLGLDPAKGEGESAHCWNCGECVVRCRTGALAMAWQNGRERRQRPASPAGAPAGAEGDR